MLLFCNINLVKFENFLLSKILGMTYNLERGRIRICVEETFQKMY